MQHILSIHQSHTGWTGLHGLGRFEYWQILSNPDPKGQNMNMYFFQKACLTTNKNACGKPETQQTWVGATNIDEIFANIENIVLLTMIIE